VRFSYLTRLAIFIILICIFFFKSSSATLAVDSNGYWEKIGPLNTPRISSGIALLNNGKVLITGSYNSLGPLNSAEIYNPSTKTWSTTGSMITPRQIQTGPGVAKFSDGNVLIAGHHINSQLIGSPLAEIYDASLGTWSSAANLNKPRFHATLLPLPNDRAILAGGSTGTSAWSNIAEIYDYKTKTWTRTGDLKIARQQNLYSLALKNGKVILVGGDSSFGPQNTSEVYDPSTGQWVLSTMPFISNYSAITELDDGKVFAAGSYTGSTVLSNAAIYDPKTNIWSQITPMPEARAGATAVLLGDKNILLVGGNDGAQYFKHSLIYNAQSNSWSTGPSLPTGFNGAAFVKLQNGDYLFTAADEGNAKPGSSTYLFTNGNNSTYLNVPYFGQNDELWGTQEYDSASEWKPAVKNTSIGAWGCALTSAVMILKYHK